jgi:hypothetical protein
MADHQGLQGVAQTEKDEPFFLLGMVRVGDQKRPLVEKTVRASSKDIPGLRLFCAFLRPSHSKRSTVTLL